MSAIRLLIPPRPAYIGFPVERLLPFREMRMVGPFIFLDRMGPATFEPETTDGDVPPHPHIGLATVTWLFSGSLVHRDSLGHVQRIDPGAVNWMTAGRGIVHSERIPPDIRNSQIEVEGIQTWAALPLDLEHTEPGFDHHPASSIPELHSSGITLRVIAGTGFGERSPVRVLSPTLFVSAEMEPGASLQLPAEHPERAVFPVSGSATIDREVIPSGSLAVIEPGAVPLIESTDGARLVMLGGSPLEGQRLVHWNFVSSRRELIEKAKNDWREARFPEIPGETGRIPLPDWP